MVVRMSCWVLETCLTHVPRQRRRYSINLPAASSALAVGVHLVTHLILEKKDEVRVIYYQLEKVISGCASAVSASPQKRAVYLPRI